MRLLSTNDLMGQDGAHNNNAPAPFLTKTYEMVDDPISNDIVSWSSNNDSFVVWNPVDFARELLPQYFKHNNFSSFVRQLNTYGFRKIDPERWEFATEGFSKGSKDSLKNIHRRKPQSHHSHRYQVQQQENQSQGGCNDPRHTELEEEIKELKKEKGTLLMELLKLKELQHGTELELQNLGDRLQALEGRQQQMVAFLARAMQSPSSFSQFVQQNESNPLLLFNKKRRLTGQDAAPEPGEAAEIDSPKAISRLEPPEGIFKQLTISCASLSGGSSSMSYNSGGTSCERNTFAGHPETPSTDGSGHSAMDMTTSGDDPSRHGFGDSVDVTVPEKGGVTIDTESINVSVLGHGNRGHSTESNPLGNEKETESVPAMPSAVDERNAPALQASQTPGYSTKKPSRKMNQTSGSNDMFWENFLTESPRTTDSDAEDEADDQEDEASPRERQFL